MYKIYINDTPIFLTNTKTAKNQNRDELTRLNLSPNRKKLEDDLKQNSNTFHFEKMKGHFERTCN